MMSESTTTSDTLSTSARAHPPLASAGSPWALFLDFDGTLVEIAQRPEAVVVSPELPAMLASLRSALDGALAVVSGRPIAALDDFLGLPGLPLAGLHGLERRHRGTVWRPAPLPGLDAARERLAPLANEHPELLLENKSHSIALHYRNAPDLAATVQAAMAAALALVPGGHLMAGKMVLELKPIGASKATAVQEFMREPPFHGAIPVFVGDDVTDEDGFDHVQTQGGLGIKVGPGKSRARHGLPNVDAVIDWLGDIQRSVALPNPEPSSSLGAPGGAREAGDPREPRGPPTGTEHPEA